METLKKFEVKVMRRQVTTFFHTFEVEADNKEDARVLGRYHEHNSWDWDAGKSYPDEIFVSSVSQIPTIVSGGHELAREAAERTGEEVLEIHQS